MALTRYNGLLPGSLTLDSVQWPSTRLTDTKTRPTMALSVFVNLGLLEKFRDSSQKLVLCFKRDPLHLDWVFKPNTIVTISAQQSSPKLDLIPRARAAYQAFANCRILDCLELLL
jgi:hypothetical protein